MSTKEFMGSELLGLAGEKPEIIKRGPASFGFLSSMRVGKNITNMDRGVPKAIIMKTGDISEVIILTSQSSSGIVGESYFLND
jgi:hypothetical protein